MSNKPIVSIIIPTRNSGEFIEKCIKSVKNQSYKNIEIIVVDNNSTDNTKEIARKFTDLVFNKGPERSTQRNFGAKKAKGEYLYFIDSDMILSKNVVSECMTKAKTEKYKALIVPEVSIGDSFWARCKTLERSFYIGVGWIESARFFKKKLFNEFNGYDEKNTGTEDFDLPQRIKNKKGENSIGRIRSMVKHDESNLSFTKTLGKKYYYAQKLVIYKVSNETYFKKQSNLLERYKLYLSYPKKLFKNPVIGLGMLFMKTCEFMAGGLGYCISILRN